MHRHITNAAENNHPPPDNSQSIPLLSSRTIPNLLVYTLLGSKTKKNF